MEAGLNLMKTAPKSWNAMLAFSVEETASLSFAIAAINVWNRLTISARTPPQVDAA
jgi:alkylhydroperoxidase family enzyme